VDRPFYGFWIFVVLTDIAHEFSLEIWNRSKYTARDDVAFNLGEPKLNLVELWGVGRSEM
jgi:hypothetical protein